MSPTQTIWLLRKRTTALAKKIIEATDRARRKEEQEPGPETQATIIEQNRILLGVLNGITEGVNDPLQVPALATKDQTLRMATEIEHQIELRTRTEPSRATIRSAYILAVTQQQPDTYAEKRGMAIHEIHEQTGLEPTEILAAVKLAAKITNVK